MAKTYVCQKCHRLTSTTNQKYLEIGLCKSCRDKKLEELGVKIPKPKTLFGGEEYNVAYSIPR